MADVAVSRRATADAGAVTARCDVLSMQQLDVMANMLLLVQCMVTGC